MPGEIFVYESLPAIDIGMHVFPTEKYSRLAAALVEQGVPEERFALPGETRDEDLARVHTEEYLSDLRHARPTPRTIASELPVNPQVIQGFQRMVGGTVRAAELAWREDRWTMHIGGGFHHAFADRAEGFCYVHDVAIAIRRLQELEGLGRVAVIDVDLHQGNGTARIFAGDESVFTFSIHQEKLYPPKEVSDIDIGLDQYVGDDEYLDRLEEALDPIYDEFSPEMVFAVCGADPYHDDQLGDLKLTFEGLRRRDELVIGEAARRGIPGVVTLAGGYAHRVEDTVKIHRQTAEVVLETYTSTKESK